MAQELAGKVAIITGGAKGIGSEAVRLFVQEGAKVVVADPDPQGAALAESLGASARYRKVDVAEPNEVQALIDYTVSEFGGLHIMYSNAGISSAMQRLLEDDLADFYRVMGVNVYGTMICTQRAARHMALNGGGSIITTSSTAGLKACFGLTNYRASKAAVAQFTKAAAIDLAAYNIRVNCILPGQVETGMLEASIKKGTPADKADLLHHRTLEMLMANQPLKRRGATADVAQVALFLASDRSAYVTGVLLPVDGGILAGDPTNHLETMRRLRTELLGD